MYDVKLLSAAAGGYNTVICTVDGNNFTSWRRDNGARRLGANTKELFPRLVEALSEEGGRCIGRS